MVGGRHQEGGMDNTVDASVGRNTNPVKVKEGRLRKSGVGMQRPAH